MIMDWEKHDMIPYVLYEKMTFIHGVSPVDKIDVALIATI